MARILYGGGVLMPWRHRVHRWFTEGRAGLARWVVLNLLMMCIGMGIVSGLELANGILDRGWALLTFQGFALGVAFVAAANVLIQLIALDYAEEHQRRAWEKHRQQDDPGA